MQISLIQLSSITIPENRQRKVIKNIEDLMESIQRLGLLNPIILKSGNILVAGERRLTAFKRLAEIHPEKYSSIPARFLENLSQLEHRMVELDENIRRQDITWQEQAMAVQEMHKLLCDSNPIWTPANTADRLGIHQSGVYRYLSIAKEAEVNQKILTAPTINSAVSTIKRMEDRKKQNVLNTMSDLLRTEFSIDDAQEELDLSEPFSPVPQKSYNIPASESILIRSAIDFMEGYKGERFNFLHCDFPYGVGYDEIGFESKAIDVPERYEDSPEVYWKLLSSLADNWDKIMAPSSHFIFWFSMKYYHETMKFIETNIPQLTLDEFPLIWGKSDGKGTFPDPNRKPRRTYETALFGYTGDRRIVKLVNNHYAAPTQRGSAIHISEKPEPVLRHFFQLIVDETTSLYDPTCGSGSALRAAESLGAKRVIGTEMNADYAQLAIDALNSARMLRSVEKK